MPLTRKDFAENSDDLDADLVRRRESYVVANPEDALTASNADSAALLATDNVPLNETGLAPNSVNNAAPGQTLPAQSNGGASGTLGDEVTFISGINPDNTLALYSFAAWNGDNPATYTGGYTDAMKWFGNASDNTAGTPGGTVFYYFNPASNWSAAEEQVFIDGYALWSAEANINFVQTSNPNAAQVTITRGSDKGANTQPNPVQPIPNNAGLTNGTVLLQFASATISIDTSVAGFGPLTSSLSTYGGYPWMTVVHEEGHTLGLGHAGPYNGTNAASQQFSPYDTRLWSLMSYFNNVNDSSTNQYAPVDATSWNGNYPTTPMIADILAAQRLYGTPSSTPLSGGQIFGFDTNITGDLEPFFDFTLNTMPVVTLWDAGTNNTLDVSGFSQADNINLNPGTFSSVDGLTNNIAIAFGTAIDKFVGGPGDDTVTANNDGDTIYGGSGNNTLIGGAGNDILQGGPYDDYLDGGSGFNFASYANATSGVTVDLSLVGEQNTIGAGYDTLTNIQGLFGSPYDDTLKGGSNGDVYLAGGAGNDILQGGPYDDYLDGGSGFNFASYANATSGVTVDLSLVGEQNTIGAGYDTLTNIQGLFGSPYDDTLKGGSNGDVYLAGGAGNDILQGGPYDDYLDGGSGFNFASYANATSGVTVDLSLVGEQNTIGAGYDTLTNIQGLFGSPYDDTLKGGSNGDVYLAGGAGNDILQGGPYDDYLDGGSGFNFASYANATSGVTVDLSLVGEQNTIGAGYDTLTNIQGLFGSPYDDTLKGGSNGDVYLAGGAGNDILQGGPYDDYLDGGSGFNFASYANATSGVTVDLSLVGEQNTIGAGYDTLTNIQGLFGSPYDDTLKGGSNGDVYLAGGAGNDILQGGPYDDYLDGGAGNDTLTGGGGSDTFAFTKGDGLDIITDFNPSADVIDMIDYGISNFNALQPFITQVGANTVISINPQNQITLQHLQMTQLSSSNFLFQ